MGSEMLWTSLPLRAVRVCVRCASSQFPVGTRDEITEPLPLLSRGLLWHSYGTAVPADM